MDYNRQNKGFVCFMYGFGRSRAVYAVLMVLVAFLLGFLTLNSGEADVLNLQIALGVMLCGLLLIFVNPKIFIIKLAGYLISLVGVMIALHNANLLGAEFNLYFYASLVFGAFMMLMLLSWFVYNARSSEINEI
ncbi:hypothetical protein HMPREF1019_01758 [Campylobacter sp. 10_1_50]|uniref:hypothetical protein n=1 Tax=Campylobacter TaxID=194 RepID=UPI0002410240|nr:MULTISPECIES: hypothetical protein [Campylobacter]EHL88542.1 hypothetical protein HMPREF1019_01758 [Campylobacter sp. 10_1_50]